MKTINLTQGKVALVDDEDYERVNALKWSALRSEHNWYAAGRHKIHGIFKFRSMHRFILNTPKGFDTDHANGNGLDNRRINIRVATRTQNQANQQKRNGKNPYKGVYSVRGGWVSRLTYKREPIYLGFFKNPDDAALAYDKKAKELHGEFAGLNFPL